MDLRTSNMLACPTCRSCFSPDVNQLIKNFTILEAKNEGEKMFAEAEAKFAAEKPKAAPLADSEAPMSDKMVLGKLQVLQKKIDASLAETSMFNEELDDIQEQLETTHEQTSKDLKDKLELLYEMLKNRLESLEQNVTQHYKKQKVVMKEAQNNLDKRGSGLKKLSSKVTSMLSSGSYSHNNKLERLEEEFLELNRSYNSSFHQFKHCTVNLNPQNAGQIFESLGSVKHPIVQSTFSNSYQYFNLKRKNISKAYFFGDSNNQELIFYYDFGRDKWRKKDVPRNLVLQSYSVAIGLTDGSILITGGLNSTFTNVSGNVSLYNPETETCSEKSPLLYNRYTHALAHYGNYVYAIGGRSINGVLESCERFSISLNKWEKIAMLNQRR